MSGVIARCQSSKHGQPRTINGQSRDVSDTLEIGWQAGGYGEYAPFAVMRCRALWTTGGYGLPGPLQHALIAYLISVDSRSRGARMRERILAKLTYERYFEESERKL